MKNSIIVFLFLFMGLVSVASEDVAGNNSCACDPFADSLELVKFYQNFNGDDWFFTSNNWLAPGVPIGEWIGITTNVQGCVTHISLGGVGGFSGELFDFQFSEIVHLNLPLNVGLTGEIPNFTGMPNLRELILTWSFNLTGELPDFAGLPKLEILDLCGCEIWSSIPDFQLPNLKEIYLFDNELIGNIPDFSNLPSLIKLQLNSNKLTGSVPNFSNLPNLEFLDIAYNDLTGEFPNFNKLPLLEWLHMVSNNFTGEFPDFSQCPDLEYAAFSGNNFTGQLPDLSHLVNLRSLWVDGNDIYGPLPDLSQWNALERFGTKNNRFTFSDIIQLLDLGITDPYSPQKPFTDGKLFYAKKGLDIEITLDIDNDLTDSRYLWRKNGSFLPPTPPNNINFNKYIIENVDLGDYASYSVTVTNTNVPGLSINGNNIVLRVCNEQNDSLELVKLYNATGGVNWTIQDNWLTPGMPISSWYGVSTDDFGCVRSLDLSSNNLVNSLPDIFFNTLDSLNLSSNKLNGNIDEIEVPLVTLVNLADNELTGDFPGVISDWNRIVSLTVSNNSLDGEIPPDLGDLCELEELRLNGNNFQGELPEELTNLFNLQVGKVDFGNNQIDSLKPKLVFFCPYGDTIMIQNPGYDRFLGICNVACDGSEWDNLSDFPDITDLLKSFDCTDANCYSLDVTAGYVNVRGITVIYVRSTCYFDASLENFQEEVQFFDCIGNLLESVTCDQDNNCSDFRSISSDEFFQLVYEPRWVCGQSIGVPTSINNDLSEPGQNYIYNLQCYPNPATDLINCEIINRIDPKSIQLYNINGAACNFKYEISLDNIQLDLRNIPRGMYFIRFVSKMGLHTGKILVE